MTKISVSITANRALIENVSPYLLISSCHGIAFPKVGNLFNIVNKAVEHPLDVDLHIPSQGESVHSLACADITEDRFYNAEPFAINPSSLWCIDLLLHLVGKASRSFTIEHMNLTRYRFGVA